MEKALEQQFQCGQFKFPKTCPSNKLTCREKHVKFPKNMLKSNPSFVTQYYEQA